MAVLLAAGYYILSVAVFILLYNASRRRQRLPPGPKGLPLIGNLFDVPNDYAWLRYKELGQQYGSDIVHMQALGNHILVLNSMKAAVAILDKRADISSDRQSTMMLDELSGLGRAWTQLGHNDSWRIHRRLFHQHFRPSAISQYHTKQTKAIRRMLSFLRESPAQYMDHIRFMAGSMILDVVYTLDVQPGDYRIKLAEMVAHVSTEVFTAGVWMVDMIPMLRHLPTWFPGAGFKIQAAKWKTTVDKSYDIPYEQFKASMHEGGGEPCLASALLSSAEDVEELERMDKVFSSLTGTAYIAGTDTTVSTLASFVLAMTIFPEAQLAAQAEIDRVLGGTRLPDINDKANLPQVTAILYETLRWNPVLPLALPHRTTADTSYDGYYIPAGTVVLGNSWAILQDETLFPEPQLFKPERYLNCDGSLDSSAHYPIETFGFGRRICPGRYFAQDAVWLAIAHILAVFKIERARDGDGKEIVPTPEFTARIVSMPKPFECNFKVRSPQAESLIESAALGG